MKVRTSFFYAAARGALPEFTPDYTFSPAQTDKATEEGRGGAEARDSFRHAPAGNYTKCPVLYQSKIDGGKWRG